MIVALLGVTLASGWLAVRQIAGRDNVAPDRYVGTVQFAPDRQGRCAQYDLDNRATPLTLKGPGQCSDLPVAARGGGTATSDDGAAADAAARRASEGLGRLQSIKDHFRK